MPIRETEPSFNFSKRPLHCVHGGSVPFCFLAAGPAGSDSACSDSAGFSPVWVRMCLGYSGVFLATLLPDPSDEAPGTPPQHAVDR